MSCLFVKFSLIGNFRVAFFLCQNDTVIHIKANETHFHTITLFFICIFFLFLTAFGLECYACSSQPELSGGTKCEKDKAENITCDPLFDSCITAEYTVSLGPLGSRSLEFRNCSSSVSCDPNSQVNCKCKNIII